MNKDTLVSMLDDYCGCIFEIVSYDSVFGELSAQTKSFCDKYHSVFKTIDKYLSEENITINQIQISVKRSYDRYVRNKLTEEKDPYEHYNDQVLNVYYEALCEYCKQTYNVPLPNFLVTIKELITIELRNSHNMKLYIISTTTKMVEESLSGSLESIERRHNAFVKDHYEKVHKEIDDLENRTTSNIKKTEKKSMELNITILGIFSAVVLAFSGMFTFSASVLQSINNASIYRVVFVALIIGLIIFNLIFCLFYYLNCMKDKHMKIRSLVPMIITDVIILFLLLGTYMAWKDGYVEKRNNSFPQTEHSQTVDESVDKSDFAEE